MANSFVKNYGPRPFVPTTSYTGTEDPLVIKGENMWVRYGRFGSIYAEGYSGNRDLLEPIATKTLTGTIGYTANSKTITGIGTLFLTELHLGSFVLVDGGAGLTELLVVTKIVTNLQFICERAPLVTASGKTGYVLPVIFSIGVDRGTAIRGNVLQFPKGHYLGVGDGTFRVNGASLSASLTLSKTPRFALYDPVANTYLQDDVGIVQPLAPVTLAATTAIAITGSTNATPIVITAPGHGLITGDTITIGGHLVNTSANGFWTVTVLSPSTFSLNGSIGIGVGVTSGELNPSQMRAGDYNIRVCRKNTKTSGYSNPSPPSIPVTLTANQSIEITFTEAMAVDQDAWDIYATPFEDNSTTTIEARYMGPWYFLKTVTASALITAATPTGREVGTTFIVSYPDAEIVTTQAILSFDNFAPLASEFVDSINSFPIYLSCLGKGTQTATNGTSPGPGAIASKPSNPEAALIGQAVTTAGSDYILGSLNAKSRMYVMCQNSLQTLILTTIDAAPIAFRSLWNTGFRNPYNLVFVKEYLYAFSTQKIVRSVAGGDDSEMEFEFAGDVRDYVVNWETGHVIMGYDPKNRAVIYFYSAYERRSGYWVTLALPFLLDKQVWNPPIILKKANTDFIVSGAATVGETLTFLAGGRTSTGSIVVGTYVFDGGDSEQKSWFLAWNYSDDGAELNAKTIKGFTVTGRFSSATDTKIKVYGVEIDGAFDFTSLQDGTNPQYEYVFGDTAGDIVRKRFRMADAGVYPLYTLRMEGSYTSNVDRLDELVAKIEVNNSEI